MVLKHKLLQDFQFTSSDKKIFVLKTGTILQQYKYKVKNETIDIDKDIVDGNPEFFEVLDWKSELLSYLKTNKVPQPSQVVKKLIPFFDDMILSSIQQQSSVGVPMDDSTLRDVERREKRVTDREDEIELRLKRIEKREESYKDDLKLLDKKEDSLRDRSKELTEKQLDIEDREHQLNSRERSLDRNALESAKDVDIKYAELQSKIDKDLRSLSEKEKDIDLSMRDLKKRESKIEQREAEIDDKIRDLEIQIEETKNFRGEMKKYNCQGGGCYIMLRS